MSHALQTCTEAVAILQVLYNPLWHCLLILGVWVPQEVTGMEWVRSILPSAYPELLASLVGEKYSADIARRAEATLLGHVDDPSASSTDKRLLAM